MTRPKDHEADLLYGVKHIAKHLGLTKRQVEYMIAKGSIPHFKSGKIICSMKSALQRHFQELLP